MESYFKSRMQEISHLLDNEDLNRAGIRILDLVYDLGYPYEVRMRAQKLRLRYNQAKELGKKSIDDPHLTDEYRQFVSSLPQEGAVLNAPEKKLIASAEGISKQFRTRMRTFTLEALNLEMNQGSIIGVVGENGNGKTTLLRMIAGDLACDTGKVLYYFDRQACDDWAVNKYHIAFVQQRTERFHGQVYENLSFMAAIKGIHGQRNREMTEFVLHRMGLSNFAAHSWAQLSSGYRLRFEIARALVWDPSILILDEPLANLDLQAQEQMLNDLRNLADSPRNPMSIIISSQQLYEVEAVSDQIIFLKNGRAVYNGTLADFRNMQTLRTFELNGRFTIEKLMEIFSDWKEVRIENGISAMLLTCPNQYSQQDLLKKLVDNQMEIEYLRDITGSTKQLFNDKF